MRRAEEVTFGGNDLDRRADLRGESIELSQKDTARYILFWEGKVAINTVSDTLFYVSKDNALLKYASEPPLFLGIKHNVPYFASNLDVLKVLDVDEEALGSFIDNSVNTHSELPQNHGFFEMRAQMTRLGREDAELALAAKGIFNWHATHQFCAKCGAPSESSLGGWQRTCPVCNASHFPRTDPVVIMLITHGNDVLLGRSPGWPETMYSLLAGFMEPGETIEAAVRREVLEESGVHVGPINYLASQPWPFPSSLMIGCAGIAKSKEIVIDPNELEDAMWVSRETLVDAISGKDVGIMPARAGSIAHFLIHQWLKDDLI